MNSFTQMQRALGSSAIGLGMIAATATADWTVINLHPTDAGATFSDIRGSGGAQQGGSVRFGTPDMNAALWIGSAASFVNLHPTLGVGASRALAVGDGQQGGWYSTGVALNPALWSGTADSFVNLTPLFGSAPAYEGLVYGVGGGRQVGSVTQFQGGPSIASLWSGTAASWTSLNPDGAFSSIAFGIHAGQQVGSTRSAFDAPDRAAMWNGDAASYMDLHPDMLITHGSSARATDGAQQVGWTRDTDTQRTNAALWSGTSDSWVNLHPLFAQISIASAVDAGYQVGFVQTDEIFDETRVAALWNGTADSFVDLHQFLSGDFLYSSAQGIVVSGDTIVISGTGFNSVTGREEALLWVRVIPAPGTAALLSLGGVMAARRRRN